MQRIGVIGGGAFGTAMASVAARAGREVTIWAREPDVVNDINSAHVNSSFLAGIELPRTIRATADFDEVCDNEAVLIAVPTAHLRSVIADAAAYWRPGVPALICSKGVERETCKLMAEVVADCLGRDAIIAALGGPTFAADISRDLPAAATLACPDLAIAEQLAAAFATKNFRAYASDDIIGAQLGGATKNVLAIASGIVTSMGLGDSARAALMTRGLDEVSRLGMVLGAQHHTMMGLCCVGDIVLTCGATQSRNFSVGLELGKGRSLEDIMAGRKTVAEGVHNAESVTELARRNQVDMPICLAVQAILNVDADLTAIIHGLLSRPLVVE